MALVVDRRIVDDAYARVTDGEPLPDDGAVLVTLETWCANETALRSFPDTPKILARPP